ncbi:MAG: YdbL family protein [Desulfobacterales bacterium]|nr:YdbL family protein [Desulfobacterales bacterium]
MKKRWIKLTFAVLLTALFIFSGIAFAGGIKQRMTQRLPAITDLKGRGIVGETNRGYLGFVTGTREKEAVVAAENKDRKMIYKKIASDHSVSLDRVEKRRAKILSDKTLKGHFYQNSAGAWVQK